MFDPSKIRIVEDFPKKGIKFYDITTIMNDSEAFRELFNALVEKAKALHPDVIVALETRGYFFGPALALELGLPFVPVRKIGKLPYSTYQESYDLEYGKETIEIHSDAIKPKQRVLIFDDILATGGTASAAIRLVKHFDPTFVATCFLMEISSLNGKARLKESDEVGFLFSV